MRPKVHDPLDELGDRVASLADRLGLKRPRAWHEVAEEGLLAIEGRQDSILTEDRKDDSDGPTPTTFEFSDTRHRALYWGEDTVTAFCGLTTFHADTGYSLDGEGEDAMVDLLDEPFDFDDEDACPECRAELMRLREGM